MRPALAVLALFLLDACAAVSPLAGRPGLERTIREAHNSFALERNGICIRPEIHTITQARVLRDDPEWLEVEIRYSYRPEFDAASSADRNICSGFASRRFLFRKAPKGLELWDMSGPRRTTPYYTLFTADGIRGRISVPPWLEGFLPLPETLPRRVYRE